MQTEICAQHNQSKQCSSLTTFLFHRLLTFFNLYGVSCGFTLHCRFFQQLDHKGCRPCFWDIYILQEESRCIIHMNEKCYMAKTNLYVFATEISFSYHTVLLQHFSRIHRQMRHYTTRRKPPNWNNPRWHFARGKHQTYRLHNMAVVGLFCGIPQTHLMWKIK